MSRGFDPLLDGGAGASSKTDNLGKGVDGGMGEFRKLIVPDQPFPAAWLSMILSGLIAIKKLRLSTR